MRHEELREWWSRARAVGEPPDAGLIESIERRLTADLTAVRPMATGRMAAAVALAMAACVAAGAMRLGVLAPARMTLFERVAVYGSLALAGGWLVAAAVRQSAPGSRHRVSPRLLAVAIPVALAALLAALFPLEPQPALLPRAWSCFCAGAPVAAVAGALAWGVLRRGFATAPRLAGATTGLLAGLAGAAALSLHCPNLNGWHVLLGHLSVAVAGAVAGFALAEAAGRIR
jgi:hypothetical protein